MKDLVEFNSRDEFDSYMRDLEQSFYDQKGVVKPPYQDLPSFPPQPYQNSSKKSKSKGMQKDYID